MDALLQSLNPGFALAALVTMLAFGVHCILGSRLVVRPLLKARDITPPSRWINFFTWHAVTVLLAFMAAGFAWAAARPDAADVAAGLTAVAATVVLLGLYVCRRARFRPWRVPPVVLFAVISLAGVWGLAA
jgi:hypothetical protein